MRQLRTYYGVLKVDRSAPKEVIRSARRALLWMYHPDRNHHPRAGDAAAEINVAYMVLSDPVSRAAYDKWLSDQGANRSSETSSSQSPSKGGPAPPPKADTQEAPDRSNPSPNSGDSWEGEVKEVGLVLAILVIVATVALVFISRNG